MEGQGSTSFNRLAYVVYLYVLTGPAGDLPQGYNLSQALIVE